jgi:predicted AlkP superfamily phosphohydrolase/phosphomutase
LVIGLDGATWDILQPWIEAGDLPNLAAFQEEAAWGTLYSVVPYLSPTAWTSAFTGVNPGRHAIFDFQRRLPTGGVILSETARSRRASPIWKMLEGTGLRMAFINIPMTDPPDPVDGIMISGLPHPDLTGWSYPPELEEEFPQYRLDKMEMMIPPGTEDSLLAEIRETLDRRWEVTKTLFQREDWDLFWVVFTGSDRMQHMFWGFMEPDPRFAPERVAKYRDAIHDFWVHLDEILGEFLELAGPDRVVFLMSDHGFQAMNRELRVHPYLAQQEESPRLRELVSQVTSLDPTDACRLYVKKKGREPDGVLEDPLHGEVVRELRDVLRHAVDPANGDTILAGCWTRDEVFWGPYAGKGPDVVMVPNPPYFVVSGDKTGGLDQDPLGDLFITLSGWHSMRGLYAVRGPNIPPGHRSGDDDRAYSLLDVTPTLIYLLGQAIPEGLDGRIMEGLFEPGYVSRHPPEMRPPMEETFEEGPIDTTGLRNLPYIGG